MAYYVGQLRKDGSNSQGHSIYMESLSIDKEQIFQSKNPFSFQNDFNENSTFEDFSLKIKSNDLNEKYFSSDYVYYLRFKVLRIPQYFYSADTHYGQYMDSYEFADDLSLTIELRSSDSTYSENYQTIGTCSIPRIDLFNDTEKNELEGLEEEYDYVASQYEKIKYKSPYASFTFVFSPDPDLQPKSKTPQKEQFDTIVFRIQRMSYDVLENPGIYQGEEGNIEKTLSQDGRTWLKDYQIFAKYENEKYTRIATNNIEYKYLIDLPTIIVENQLQEKYLNKDGEQYDTDTIPHTLKPVYTGQLSKLFNINDNQKWIKIGYQCRPGSLIIINKEPIRVGKSGIFELDNGLPITDFRIANPGGSNPKYIDAFLLDYAYATKKVGG